MLTRRRDNQAAKAGISSEEEESAHERRRTTKKATQRKSTPKGSREQSNKNGVPVRAHEDPSSDSPNPPRIINSEASDDSGMDSDDEQLDSGSEMG
ncbi:hypothetical protein KIN20_022395 [Parelaphostrongylus tenuis]|uniref:Uncharacterized protein n=1 Tax=Parelaphostrongylus tenuis TaxID=148309 RepID=A0AAD5MQJ6_PARTN|nr:hypothetical protein KIN20_022394 [Parelaphostrongylus tenuis]KAJ1362732.1 hypothetical protein KIN20_022395 [Parelaphostrongylus tenuis]